MNVIELLKTDHETVADLFKSFESAKESEKNDEKQQIVGQICQELTVHATVEEEIFYPAVEARGQEDEKAQDSVKEAHEEHALVKALVAELGEMGSEDEQFDAKVKVLKDLVEHHVEEEEGQMMPKAKKLMESEELEELGMQVESRKEQLRREPAAAGRATTSARSAEGARSAPGSRTRGSSSRSSSRRSTSSRPTSSSSGKSARSPRPARRRTGGRKK